MNSLTVGIGQAGVQIASELSMQMLTNHIERYINPNDKSAKTFLVDSESKVIESVLQSEIMNKYFSKHTNIITNSSGRGNNWALGHSIDYKEFKSELNINIDAFDHFTSFLEKCDFIQNILIIHSLNGGTGSGVGSRLTEMIRDSYSKLTLIDCPVFGYEIENTTLSQFNTFFSIGTVYDIVDHIILIKNEKFNRVQNKTFDYTNANKITAGLLGDCLTFSAYSSKSPVDLLFTKYYSNNKFVDISQYEYNYITELHMTSEKICENLFHDAYGFEKGKRLLTLDMIYKANCKVCDYMTMHKAIAKHKKCEVNQDRFAIDKNLKLNKMTIGCYYKSTGVVGFLNTILETIEQKLNARYVLITIIRGHIIF